MNAKIRLCGIQHLDGESETVEQTVSGELTALATGWRLTYPEDASCPDRLTTLLIAPDRVILTRPDPGRTRLIMERGRHHDGTYDTGFGILPLGLYTDTVETALTAAGGTVYVAYTIDQNGQTVSSHELRLLVTVSEKG